MDARNLKDLACRLFARHKFVACAGVYAQLIREGSRDPLLRLRHADASRRAGQIVGAVESYRTAAELYAADGHLAQAKVALRLALELAPVDPYILLRLRQIEELWARATGIHLTGGASAMPEPRAPLHVVPETPVDAPDGLPAEQGSEGPDGIDVVHGTRIGDQILAFQTRLAGGWVVVYSDAPVDVGFVTDEEFERLRNAPDDAESKMAAADEGASALAGF